MMKTGSTMMTTCWSTIGPSWERAPPGLDALLATGEIVSAGIVTAALEARGIRARAQDVSAGGDVVRLLPPLNVSFPELEEDLDLLRDAFP